MEQITVPQRRTRPQKPKSQPKPQPSNQLKVGSRSEPKKVAGAIIACVKKGFQEVIITTMGPKALNNAVEASIIAEENLSKEGFRFFIRFESITLKLDGAERPAKKMTIVALKPT